MRGRVESATLHLVARGADQALDSAQHLLRGAARECQEEDPLGLHAALDQVGDAVHQCPCLACACASDDQERAVTVRRRRELRRVEIGHAGIIAPGRVGGWDRIAAPAWSGAAARGADGAVNPDRDSTPRAMRAVWH